MMVKKENKSTTMKYSPNPNKQSPHEVYCTILIVRV